MSPNSLNPTFTFKHLEPLESIKQFAANRIGKLEKYSLHKEPKIHFVFSVQRQDQVAEIIIDAGRAHFTAIAKDPVLYNAIDRVVEKIERQLLKHKEKVQDHHHRHTREGAAAELDGDSLAERFEIFRQNLIQSVKKKSRNRVS